METKPEIEIREMEFADLKPVFQLGERLFRADEWPALYRTWDEYELMQYYLSDGEYCFVAECNKRIVGFIIGSLIWKRKSSWVYGYIAWTGISRRFQKQGVASRLVKRVTDLFIKNGARMMLVDTAFDNEPAINFFQKNGFSKTEKHLYLSKNLTHDPKYLEHIRRAKIRRKRHIV